MRKIGILGGTFNPPHIGHLIIANEVRQALGLDEVRLMPTSVPPHKKEPGDATAAQRLEMVQLAVQEVEGLIPFDFEVNRGGISYSYETMKELKAIEPNSDFHFIIGDMIDSLPTWYRIDELMSLTSFVGVGRPGFKGKSNLPVKIVNIPQIDLSSTLIRNRIIEGGTVNFLIPPAVEAFIRKEGLYGCTGINN